jgi:hypothetical protein
MRIYTQIPVCCQSCHGTLTLRLLVSASDRSTRQFDFPYKARGDANAHVESINSNEYKTEAMKQKVMGGIRALHQQDRLPLASIPMEPELCQRLVSRIEPEEAKIVLHPDCHRLYTDAQ